MCRYWRRPAGAQSAEREHSEKVFGEVNGETPFAIYKTLICLGFVLVGGLGRAYPCLKVLGFFEGGHRYLRGFLMGGHALSQAHRRPPRGPAGLSPYCPQPGRRWPLARRKALLEALDDGSAGDKLKETLKKLAAERPPTRKRYIPIRER